MNSLEEMMMGYIREDVFESMAEEMEPIYQQVTEMREELDSVIAELLRKSTPVQSLKWYDFQSQKIAGTNPFVLHYQFHFEFENLEDVYVYDFVVPEVFDDLMSALYDLMNRLTSNSDNTSISIMKGEKENE